MHRALKTAWPTVAAVPESRGNLLPSMLFSQLLHACHATGCCCCRGPFEAGKPLTGGGIGLVKASKSSKFNEGDVVNGMVPWSTYFIADATSQVRNTYTSHTLYVQSLIGCILSIPHGTIQHVGRCLCISSRRECSLKPVLRLRGESIQL